MKQSVSNTGPSETDFVQRIGRYIAALALAGLLLHVLLRFVFPTARAYADYPLFVVLACGGLPLVYDLLSKALRAQFGADLLAGISIVTSVLLGEYLAGSLVVLMLSGGEALEAYAMRRASSVLEALAKRMPSIAHRRESSGVRDINIEEIQINDILLVYPHEICPVDGVVIEGRSAMDEAYLTGEPFLIRKTPGAEVVSGAINGDGALTIRALRLPKDSRYAKIISVMDDSKQRRPRLRRLADSLGAWYTPLAVLVASAAWIASGDPMRFLAVLVIATPCPLLIAIPIAIVGTISLAAKRSIIIKDPAILEQLNQVKTIIFDKTGTLTYGTPELSTVHLAPGQEESSVLANAASIERYSKHPLAKAVITAAQRKKLALREAADVEELPGKGLRGHIDGAAIEITGRQKVDPVVRQQLPAQTTGLECVVLIDGAYAATFQFHDKPRPDSRAFVHHLPGKHAISKSILLSGDREGEVALLAERVGISTVYAEKSPEEKVAIVRAETREAPTLFLGDGINDAPALFAATVGVAFGPKSDITSEAAGAVILEPTLSKVDELLHIGTNMRRVALQSAVGGMVLSIGGMGLAAFGFLTPVAGALLQELIDLFAVINALRAASPTFELTDL